MVSSEKDDEVREGVLFLLELLKGGQIWIPSTFPPSKKLLMAVLIWAFKPLKCSRNEKSLKQTVLTVLTSQLS